MGVSTTEALDALQATAGGLEDRDDFQHALAATVVKEARDLPTFDRIFDLDFFDLKGLGAEAAKARGREDLWAKALLERLLAEADLEVDEASSASPPGETGHDREGALCRLRSPPPPAP